MIRVHAEVERNINSAVEGSDKVVELDSFKYQLSQYTEPLAELRDSL